MGETKTVEVEAELQASADDVWGLLTEEGKIPMWSRSAAQVRLRCESIKGRPATDIRSNLNLDRPTRSLAET